MRQAGWRRALTVATVVPVMTVTGCVGGDPGEEPTVTAVVSASTTPSPSPSPTVDLTRLPEKPAAMAEPTTDGAIAAATYVLDLFAYSFASGDTAPWRAITAESCELCVGLVDDVEEMVASGDASTGAEMAIEQAEAQEIAEDRWFGVDMVVSQGPAQRFDSEGNVVSSEPGGRYSAAFALSWDEGWRVDQLGFQELVADGAGED